MIERVAICICTYHRPEGLERLLRALNQLEFAKTHTPEIEVLVVDNDPEGSASEACISLRQQMRWPLRYALEPRRGISQARNRALTCAAERADYAAFLDDDEVPTPEWLDELLHVRRTHSADGVAGPVLARFEEPAPPWVKRGRFFELPRHRTGEHYRTGRRFRSWGTGNILLRLEAVLQMESLFDERLALAGGEDTDFFLRFTDAGFCIVWADEAVVDEWVPPTRVRTRWILQREYRSASTWSQCDRKFRPTVAAQVERTAKAILRVLQGILLLPLALRGRHGFVHALRYIARGAGQIAGLIGLRYEEYGVTHGT